MSTQIVILGGGQAGYLLFSKLALRRGQGIHVTLIEKKARHELHHLLHLYAVGLVGHEEVSRPLDAESALAKLVNDEVTDIDLERKRVVGRKTSTPYDILVIALGAMVDFRGVEGASLHAVPLRSLADAERIRRSVARLVSSGSRHDIVVVGGGPSGVSLASTLADFTASGGAINLALVEDGDCLLEDWGPLFRERVTLILQEKGVQIACGAAVERVGKSAISTRAGTFRSSLTLWTAGVTVPDCIRPEIFERSPSGRLIVDHHCRVANHSDIFAIGDVSYQCGSDGRSPPQCSQQAVLQAHYLAETLCQHVHGQAVEPFQAGDWKSSRALLVGRNQFVAQIDKNVLTGSFEEITIELSRLARTHPELLPYLNALVKEELERRKRELSFLERKLAHELEQATRGSS